MIFEYTPEGTCSFNFIFDIEDKAIKSLKIEGGCSGNTQGISKLVEGMKVEDVINRLDGIKCGFKPTSCPDQIAKALKKYLESNQ